MQGILIKILKLCEKQALIQYVGEKAVERLSQSREYFLPLGDNRCYMTFRYFNDEEVTIYVDEKDFIICTDEKKILDTVKKMDTMRTGALQLHEFFMELTSDDIYKLQALEKQIMNVEDQLLIDSNPDRKIMFKIVAIRKELLKIKRYYVQLGFLTDEMSAANSQWNLIEKKMDRLLDFSLHLQEYVEQVREAYQSQIDIEQNNIMKIFTVVTTIFLPLTLIVGWYGMNLMMPEFQWEYGYPLVIGISAAVVIALVVIFKKKKWF